MLPIVASFVDTRSIGRIFCLANHFRECDEERVWQKLLEQHSRSLFAVSASSSRALLRRSLCYLNCKIWPLHYDFPYINLSNFRFCFDVKYYGLPIFSAMFPLQDTYEVLNLLPPYRDDYEDFLDEDDFRLALRGEEDGLQTYLWLVHLSRREIVAPILRNNCDDTLFEDSFRFFIPCAHHFVPEDHPTRLNVDHLTCLPSQCPEDIERALDITIPFECSRDVNGFFNLSCRVYLRVVDRGEQMRRDELWRKAKKRDLMSCFAE